MTDNIVKFPGKELDIELELEETEEEYMEMVEAINTMLEMHIAGLLVTSEANWRHVMDACMSMAVSAGLRAGLSAEEIQSMMRTSRIHEVEYDA
jgi:hypothetical protein